MTCLFVCLLVSLCVYVYVWLSWHLDPLASSLNDALHTEKKPIRLPNLCMVSQRLLEGFEVTYLYEISGSQSSEYEV
jgi:hypothetical protein